MKFAAIYGPAHNFLRHHVGKEVLIVAMERSAADHVVRRYGGSHSGIHRYSLRQLITTLGSAVLAKRGWRPITLLSAEALAAQVIDGTKLTYFLPVARTPGFPGALVETITRTRLQGQALPAGDLSVLSATYEAALQEHALAGPVEQIEAAIEAIELGKHVLSGLPTLLLDIRPDNDLECAFVEALSVKATTVESVTSQVAEATRPRTALQALQQQLFEVDVAAPADARGVSFFSASGESLESVEIARRILASALPFDSCAVLLRSPGRYQPLIEDAFRRAGIGAWFTRGVIRPDSAGRSFLALLRCAEEGLTASRFGEYLSHEQKEHPYGWEKLLVDAAVIGGSGRWRRRLNGLLAELQDRLTEAADEPSRKHIEWQSDRLERLVEFALPLIERLEGLRAPRAWGEWLDGLRPLAEAALDNPISVLDLLDELEPLRDLGPIALPEVVRALSENLGTLRREPKGNRYGRVFVGSIEEARGLVFQLVFIPGLCEGTFPKPLFDDPLLPGNVAELEARERLLLRQACATSTGEVVLSWPRIELASGRVRVPSFYVLEAARASTGEALDRRAIERTAEEGIETRVGWPAPLDTRCAIDDGEYDLARLRHAITGKGMPGLAAYLTQINPTLARSLRTRWSRWSRKWSAADGLVRATSSELKLFERFRLSSRSYSPSALQLFASCPYRFALSSLIGLTPMKEPAALERLDPLTRGSMFHEIQKRLMPLLGGYPANQAAISEASNTLNRILFEVAAEYAERRAPAIDQIWKNEVERLYVDLRTWLVTVATDHLGWVAFDSEKTFDKVVIGNGWRLGGRMDLVEQSPDGALWVTDYKTGSYPDPPPEITGQGEVLQPLLYALAAEQLYPSTKVGGGRLFYATVRGGYRSIWIPLHDGARNEVERVLFTIDAAIGNGVLLAAPREDACARCDYAVICGPYEEERILRKSPAELLSLVQLREVK
jgi:CRISPR/Cas system-associated exonuclease Cas4 (RecB family)